MHEDFCSVAATVALVYLLAGVFFMHWVLSNRGSSRWWRMPVLYVLLVLPTTAVVIISLTVLSDIAQDTEGWRRAVTALVFAQMAGGGGGLFAQAASVKI